MNALKQSQKSISDFGSEMEKLSAKLAAAHVSMGTFANEAAAVNIVEPIAVQSFIDGLKDPSTKFFLKARNPPTLNKAISDALECQATPNTDTNDNMMALWCSSSGSGRHGNFRARGGRGYGGYRGYQNNRGRGNGRGRGHYQNHYQERNFDSSNQSQFYNQGRGSRGNRPPRYNNNNNNRTHAANVAEHAPEQSRPRQPANQQTNQPTEEANLIDLFR